MYAGRVAQRVGIEEVGKGVEAKWWDAMQWEETRESETPFQVKSPSYRLIFIVEPWLFFARHRRLRHMFRLNVANSVSPEPLVTPRTRPEVKMLQTTCARSGTANVGTPWYFGV